MIRLKDLLLEKNYNYQIPEDKQKLLYDFYMISFLKTLNFDKVGDQRDSGNNIVSVGMVRGIDEKTKVSFQEAKNKLIPNLKKHLLNAVFFAVCAEFRHVFDNNSNTKVLNFFKRDEDFIRNYALYYNALSTNKGEFLKLDKLRRYSEDSRGYQDSYKAVINSGVNKHEFITIAKEAFTKLRWANSYGGKPWANICEGWLKLNDARQEDMVFVWIDHVYDLQHNTDSVFNKLKSYYKDGYQWIKTALDHKAKISNPLEIIDEVSGTLRSMALEILKGVGYGDYEQFLKKSHNSKKLKNKTWKGGTWETWKGGTWKNGTWENGTWEDGTWENGIWENGTWEDGTWKHGTWINGSWVGGTWKDGTWKKGTWWGGTWKGGIWEDGTWEDGTWKDGVWYGGTWKKGTWEYGTWINGSWEGGTWQGGWIYDKGKKGNFEEGWEWDDEYVRSPISPKEYWKI